MEQSFHLELQKIIIMKKINVKDICIIAVSTAIIFVLEQLLSFLPNIQLTVFLIVLFSKKLKFLKTIIIVIIHTILDNLVMGSFNIIFFPFMLIGWSIIPIMLSTLFKKINSSLGLSLLGILFSFIYCFIMIIPNIIILKIEFLPYFIADIPFELLLALSSFLSILWLYKPCCKLFDIVLDEKE